MFEEILLWLLSDYIQYIVLCLSLDTLYRPPSVNNINLKKICCLLHQDADGFIFKDWVEWFKTIIIVLVESKERNTHFYSWWLFLLRGRQTNKRDNTLWLPAILPGHTHGSLIREKLYVHLSPPNENWGSTFNEIFNKSYTHGMIELTICRYLSLVWSLMLCSLSRHST